MRIAEHAILGPAPAAAEVTIAVDGRPLTARAGEPILMALLAHGIARCRTMPDTGAPRGLFCGVGRCPDCAMTVDGVLNVRTCVTPVREGMRIETQQGLGHWGNDGRRMTNDESAPHAAEEPGEQPRPSSLVTRHSSLITRHSSFVIVGAGPAGLAAALAAARAGARPLVLDEWPEPGGRLRHTLATVGDARGVALAGRLAERARESGVEFATGAVAWGLFAENALGVALGEERAVTLRPETVVLATGATDIAAPFPGWTLPGVFLTSAVERAITLHRVVPGARFLVVGAGADAVHAAETIRAGGGEVVATVPAGAVRRAAGDGRVERATVATDGGERDLAVDAVCLALGRVPDCALARQRDVALTYDAARGGHLPARDARGQTSVAGLYIAGEAAGALGAEAALRDGARVGCAAAGGDPADADALVADLLA
ncbi:MAG TPA: 2Fe-2S iron-sulfur cluster-binding protein [Thermomicrobiales bacterium]|nr:2Fe-2S iron-sulfur cluster-binding protein [Thermomicrobiales bacterium]